MFSNAFMLFLELAKISMKIPQALLRYLEKTTGGGYFDPNPPSNLRVSMHFCQIITA